MKDFSKRLLVLKRDFRLMRILLATVLTTLVISSSCSAMDNPTKNKIVGGPSESGEYTGQAKIVSIHKSPNGYASIEELNHFCHAPGQCGKRMECEGEKAKVKGYVDYSNLFDKKNYPQLPYEKFVIHDKKGKTLEVWAVSDDNSEIFEKIHQSKEFPEKMVLVNGIIAGFDMPTMGACHRGIKIEIKKASDISFEH